jgi:hypothetical protein
MQVVYKIFNSISKISYVRKHSPIINDENTTISPVEQPIVSNETPSVEDSQLKLKTTTCHAKEPEAPKGSAADSFWRQSLLAEDWFLTRVTAPDISTKNLF